MPSHFSFCALSEKTSAIQVMAATNSMHTPTNVAQRQKMKTPSVWLNAPATGENE